MVTSYIPDGIPRRRVSASARMQSRMHWQRIKDHARKMAESYDIPVWDALLIRLEVNRKGLSTPGTQPTLHLPVKRETWELIEKVRAS